MKLWVNTAQVACSLSRLLPVRALSPDPVRAIMELAGVKDVFAKSLGTNNAMNIVKAAAEGLKNMQSPQEVAERRNMSVAQIFGTKESA